MLRLILASLFFALCVISFRASYAAEADVRGELADTSPTGRPEAGTATPIIQFGKAMMTDERARSLAEASGFTYIRWFPCSGNVQKCVVLEVLGKKGRIFQYHLLDERCITVASKPVQTRLDPDTISAPRSTAAGHRATAKSATTGANVGATTNPNRPAGAAIDPDEGKGAVSCLGGFRALARARQENSYLADNLGFYMRLHQTFQVVNDGRWTNVVGFISDVWQLPVAGTGLTERGHSYEMLDGAGATMDSGGDSYQYIASSGSSDVSVAEKCGGKRDSYQAQKILAIEIANAVCTLTEWIVPDVTIEGAFAPAGVGGIIAGTWDFPYCEPAKDTFKASSAVAATKMYEDCLAHPGRYFPGEYPPVLQPLILHESSGYLPTIPEKISFEGDCPPYTEKVSSFAIGKLSCTVATPYTCEKKKDGQCECKRDERLGSKVETVCTEG